MKFKGTKESRRAEFEELLKRVDGLGEPSAGLPPTGVPTSPEGAMRKWLQRLALKFLWTPEELPLLGVLKDEWVQEVQLDSICGESPDIHVRVKLVVPREVALGLGAWMRGRS